MHSPLVFLLKPLSPYLSSQLPRAPKAKTRLLNNCVPDLPFSSISTEGDSTADVFSPLFFEWTMGWISVIGQCENPIQFNQI